MTEEAQPESHCVPYKNRGRYYASTAMLFIIQGWVFLYFWTINPVLSLIMVVLYIGTSYFQAYCCVFQDCPYVGEFCPAISGIYLGNVLARRLY